MRCIHPQLAEEGRTLPARRRAVRTPADHLAWGHTRPEQATGLSIRHCGTLGPERGEVARCFPRWEYGPEAE